MTEDEIRELQALLNKVGGLLDVDGKTGKNTRRAVSEARALAGLPPGEEAGAPLLDWLRAQPEPSADLPTRGVVFIATEEVGGRDFYESHVAMPVWPGGESGITIGVGYDLRFSTDIFEGDWAGRLSEPVLARLRPHLGQIGSKEKAESLSDIRIPWPVSWHAYVVRSLPLQVGKTKSPYPKLMQLPGLCRSVLVSLVFNRGPALDGESRKEMKRIAELVDQGKLDQVPEQLLSMRRLWPDAEGLRTRREREAKLWTEGLAEA